MELLVALVAVVLGIPGAILAIALIIRGVWRYKHPLPDVSRPEDSSPVPVEPPPAPPVAAPPVAAPPPAAPPPPAPRWRDRPAALYAGLFGRAGDLDALTEACKEQRWIAVAGSAGVGKSQLAAEWTHRSGVEGFWTTARESAPDTLAALAPLLGVDGGRPEAEVVAEVQGRLADLGESEATWVVDNARGLQLCREVRDLASPGPRILFTTRDTREGQLPPNFGRVEVRPLAPEDSVALLKSRDYDGPDDGLERVAGAAGHLPLALELLAGSLGSGAWSVDALLQQFAEAPAVTFEAFRADPRTAGPQPNIERGEGVFATMTAILDGLPEQLRERVAGLGYLADAPIPVDLFAVACGVERDSAGWRELIDQGQRQTVFRLSGDSARVHALMAAAIAATDEGAAVPSLLVRTSDRLRELRTSPPTFLAEEAHYQALHAAADFPETDDEFPLRWERDLGFAYWSAGRFSAGIALWEQNLEATAQVLGEEHPETLTSRNNLAESYRTAGRLDEAIALHERTLAAREQELGEEHPETLNSRNNLALSYRAAGRWDEAIALHERTLAARERVLGEEHPETLNSRNNLAASYHGAGRLDEAIALHERTLEARERVLGEEHPDTLTSRNNLASSYQEVGRSDEAIALHERTLEALQRVLGGQHPNTVATRRNLMRAYERAGRDEDAARLRAEPGEAADGED